MQNFTYFNHGSVTKFVVQLTKIWDIYGSAVHKLSTKYKHELVNIGPQHIRNSEFGQWVTSNLGEIENCKFFICAPNSWGEVHIDGPAIPRQCGINIPIANCNIGSMNWFSNTDDSSLQVLHNTNVRTSNNMNNVDHWTAKESMILTKPALVRTHMWHNIDNRLNPLPRIVFSIRLVNNPRFDDILDKIKPWAIT